MPLIERYILRRTTNILLLTLVALVATVWVTQVLRRLDVVTAKGQAIWIFLMMTILTLPTLVQLVAPIALLVAIIITLNNLTSDSELPVISAAGASGAAVNRPILLLTAIVMFAVILSHHFVAPVSLTAFRVILTQVRADVIATLVQDGGFRSVDDGLTMHIRKKTPDGGFQGIFVNDDRDPAESRQYSAAQGMLLERTGESFLVLQDGDLIRENRERGETNVVDFDTYALDLSQLGAPNATATYEAQERSTLYLMDPETDDPYHLRHPLRISAELHDRLTSPLYTLMFALIALAFLARPRTSRQDRSFAIVAVVVLCVGLRGGGYAALALARNHAEAVPFMYLIPLAGIAFGTYATMRQTRLGMPGFVGVAWDAATWPFRRMMPREQPADATSGDWR